MNEERWSRQKERARVRKERRATPQQNESTRADVSERTTLTMNSCVRTFRVACSRKSMQRLEAAQGSATYDACLCVRRVARSQWHTHRAGCRLITIRSRWYVLCCVADSYRNSVNCRMRCCCFTVGWCASVMRKCSHSEISNRRRKKQHESRTCKTQRHIVENDDQKHAADMRSIMCCWRSRNVSSKFKSLCVRFFRVHNRSAVLRERQWWLCRAHRHEKRRYEQITIAVEFERRGMQIIWRKVREQRSPSSCFNLLCSRPS